MRLLSLRVCGCERLSVLVDSCSHLNDLLLRRLLVRDVGGSRLIIERLSQISLQLLSRGSLVVVLDRAEGNVAKVLEA